MSLFVTLWTIAHQVPLSTDFSRQDYWSQLPCPTPGDLPDPGIKPVSPVAPALQAGSFPLSPWASPPCHLETGIEEWGHCLANLSVNIPRDLLKIEFRSGSLGQGLGACISQSLISWCCQSVDHTEWYWHGELLSGKSARCVPCRKTHRMHKPLLNWNILY